MTTIPFFFELFDHSLDEVVSKRELRLHPYVSDDALIAHAAELFNLSPNQYEIDKINETIELQLDNNRSIFISFGY